VLPFPDAQFERLQLLSSDLEHMPTKPRKALIWRTQDKGQFANAVQAVNFLDGRNFGQPQPTKTVKSLSI
jgi:hypothetical protein